jgi:alpha-mannosidase
MKYDDLLMLIPSHSLEDFPTELSEPEAQSLLNSWAVAWHPALLAQARVVPRWRRADEPPEDLHGKLVMLPSCCEGWVPCGWAEKASHEGGVIVKGLTDRDELLAAVLGPLNLEQSVDPDLAADFLALGFVYLQIELLTRKMRHFTDFDEAYFQREAVAGAEAAVQGDADAAREKLRLCFEVLHTARERFYPVECHLIDLCLLIPRLADEHLSKTLLTLKPLNVLLNGHDLDTIAAEHPAEMSLLREAVERGSVTVVGGERLELPLPLLPIGSIVWQLRRGREAYSKHLQQPARIWGRRRFGVFPQFPQILKRFGFDAAMHVVLDDGIYPDHEHSKIRWEGCDGSTVEAITRIPLAADTATSFLRFPTRMAESMDNDQVAAIVFARWPEVKSPFFDDLRRMHKFAPVLGRWSTLADFFSHTDSPQRTNTYRPAEYLTPFLFQSVARQESNPISRYADHFLRRLKFEAAAWMRAMNAVLRGQSVDREAISESVEGLANRTLAVEQLVESAAPEAAEEGQETAAVQQADDAVATFTAEATRDLSQLIVHGAKDSKPGFVIVNPLSFRRTVAVEWPADAAPPQIDRSEGSTSWLQWDAQHKSLIADIPGSGFVWLPAEPSGTANPRQSPVPMAELNLLRNEFFEVHLSEETGGIRTIKGYGRTPNRLSQQLTFRFARERTIQREGPDGPLEPVKTHYAEMVGTTSEIVCDGPALGEIVTTGDIIDQTNGSRLAGFRQRVRVWRARPVVEIDIELDVVKQPDAEPWQNYYAARWAWNDEDAALTRSVMLGAHEVPAGNDQRIEAPHYIEIAVGDQQRTTIIPCGLPFHRRTGSRMFDTILVVPKEERKTFRFVVAIDQPYPMQAALDAMSPVTPVATTHGPPRSGSSGWFFHLNTRSVQILQIVGLLDEPAPPRDEWDHTEPVVSPSGRGCTLRLIETEGRAVRAKLRCFRPPTFARQRNYLGETITNVTIEGDAVLIDLTAHEIADVELRFD